MWSWLTSELPPPNPPKPPNPPPCSSPWAWPTLSAICFLNSRSCSRVYSRRLRRKRRKNCIQWSSDCTCLSLSGNANEVSNFPRTCTMKLGRYLFWGGTRLFSQWSMQLKTSLRDARVLVVVVVLLLFCMFLFLESQVRFWQKELTHFLENLRIIFWRIPLNGQRTKKRNQIITQAEILFLDRFEIPCRIRCPGSLAFPLVWKNATQKRFAVDRLHEGFKEKENKPSMTCNNWFKTSKVWKRFRKYFPKTFSICFHHVFDTMSAQRFNFPFPTSDTRAREHC